MLLMDPWYWNFYRRRWWTAMIVADEGVPMTMLPMGIYMEAFAVQALHCATFATQPKVMVMMSKKKKRRKSEVPFALMAK
jgi:hypothetical protein